MRSVLLNSFYMYQATLLPCVLALSSSVTHAQEATQTPAAVTELPRVIAIPTLNAQAIYAHAEFLSSDLLEGRATGSPGYAMAAAYVSAQFRQYGLAPAADANTYLRAVPLVEATVVLPGSSAVLRRDGVNIAFDFSKDYLPSANFFNASSSVTAPLMFAGYGIEAPEYKYNDLAELDLQGKIAVVLEGAPERLTAEVSNYYGRPTTKYASLAKAGAIGVIEIHPAADKSNEEVPNSWERAAAMSWVSQMRRLTADGQPEERFPELKLKFRFNAAAAAQLFTSNGHSFEQALQAAKASQPQGFALPGAITLSTTTGIRRTESNNVLGIVRGSDPRLQQEYILVAANLDGLGRGAAFNGDNIYNSLQRNAVGVAMMLEMARAVATLPVKPKRSILFAALTAGEKEAQGLKALLADGPIRNIVASIVIDTPMPVARTSDVITIGADQSSVGNPLVSAAQQLNLRLVRSDEPDNSVLMDSLAPLLRAGIPALALRSGNRARDSRVNVASTKRTWLQQHITQVSDDLNNVPLDVSATRELTSLNLATLLELANDTDRPVWYRSSLAYRKLTRE
ncbi:MAG: M28 family peptidase [Steroidobacteraceae bacterium]